MCIIEQMKKGGTNIVNDDKHRKQRYLKKWKYVKTIYNFIIYNVYLQAVEYAKMHMASVEVDGEGSSRSCYDSCKICPPKL